MCYNPHMSGNILEEKSFGKSLVKLILPMTLQNFMFALIPVSDAVMLVMLDQDSMSAVSLASQVMFVFNLFVYAIMSGMSLFAAQYWGKGDRKSMSTVLGYNLRLMVPISLAFFVCAFFFPEGTMRVFTNVPGIIGYGTGYLKIAAFAYISDGIAQVLVTMLKNTERVMQSMVIGICMVIGNVCLNAVFIYGLLGAPQMGARGAALATTISCTAGLVGAIFTFIGKSPVKLSLKDIFDVPMDFRKDYSKYTTPLIANQLLWGIAFTLITVIIGHLTDDAIAANAIAAIAKDLVSCFCYALAAGGAILVGNELGARRLQRGKEYGGKLTVLSIISGLGLGLLLAALAPLITSKVNLTPEAAKLLKYMLFMCSYYIMGRSINSVVIGGIFPAGGDTVFGMICDTITMWAVILPAGFIAAFVLELPVIWVYFILNLDEMIKLPVVYIHYKKYKWVRNIVNKEPVST